MSQLVLNWPESPIALELQEELAKLVSTPTKLSQPERERFLPKTLNGGETEPASRQEELKTFFAQFQADVTGYRFNREEANER
ncbi:MAG: hypothetical protein BWK78_09640 [Thiotrichaceae bacterium IS1]|nr:MAG: hypothetical protein BWK78_09640 [Thiotrichaceae bacterium IS1]